MGLTKKQKSKKNSNYKFRYDLEHKEVKAIFKKQKGKCAICKKKKVLGIDHDHKTGCVRGGLCLDCNFMLGNSGDSIKVLKEGIKYLGKKHEIKKNL